MADLEKTDLTNENAGVPTPDQVPSAEEGTPPEDNETPVTAPEPERERLYVRVDPGDTVESIAKEYGIDAQEIIEFNKINPDWISVGHWLFV